MRVCIIGAGIGGLTTAIALIKGGHEVTVYERAPRLNEVGAAITLWCNATAALAQIGAENIPDEIGSPIDKSETFDIRGKPLVTVDVEGMDSWMGDPSVIVHRHELQKALHELLPPECVVLGKQCVGVDPLGSLALTNFADGTEATADLVVGADGIRSTVRRTVTERSAVRYAGYGAWRGVVDLKWPDRTAASLFAAGQGCQWGLFRMSGDRAYWFVTSNRPADSTAPVTKEAVLAKLVDWDERFRSPIEATAQDKVLYDDIYDLAPLPRWHRGRVVLVGDAAHATTPNLGQGACQAIEDAPALTQALSTTETVEDALKSYAGKRKPRAERVVRLSRRFGRTAQLENRGLTWLRDQAIKSAPAYVQREFERIPTSKR